jgi:hypothetical protein
VWGDVVTRIAVTTDVQPIKMYPYNSDGSNTVKWGTPNNSRFVGWSGKAGSVLDSVEPLWAIFEPASWTAPSFLRRPFMRSDIPAASPAPAIPADIASRTMPNEDDVKALICEWAKDHYDAINQHYIQKGGWEGWAQVDLASRFVKAFPKTAILREEMVYEDSQMKADLLLVYMTTDNAVPFEQCVGHDRGCRRNALPRYFASVFS